jgi:hypothetical protein
MGVSQALRWLEVKPTDDEYEKIETSRWGNKDSKSEKAPCGVDDGC